MRILLTGGTGLIGRSLCQHWATQGHELWVWSRRPLDVPGLCADARGIARLEDFPAELPLDAVINLAGAPIADRPWTTSRRQVLWQSRIDLTRRLVAWMAQHSTPIPVLISGSAVGWYGDGGEQAMNEASPPGQPNFGSALCSAWEHEAARARPHGTRVVLLRTAPVLSPDGGMLARLRLPFSLGLGGRLGNGQQWMPWIHLDDQVTLIDFLLKHADCDGPINACAPDLVRNAEFTRLLARSLHRPALLPLPAWVLRLALGEMSVLLLGGQRLAPTRLLSAGFAFRHPDLAQALATLR
ncbi:TIGR01777 family oxidoreductase [Corticimicrobacter populi]|uniref:TIGR01777 family protein n=1 Tax=Corticimicrobacter populi TaxID=2175229 RepID=A0A2V1K0W7_9BURK|nr:TIGR01777 family oxidoreductase [Corticimicrobacter populi]PWF22668.1 TIGR01777 family protein [Corticimicrobacter populi]